MEFVDAARLDCIWFREHQFTQKFHGVAPLVSVVDAAQRTIELADHLTAGPAGARVRRGSYVYEYRGWGIRTEIEGGERQREGFG